MGGAVSSGENNDELVDNLVEAEYIKSADVEKVFRAVDRADYYLQDHRDTAYRDLAWKNGNIHLSAPCIYAEVLESLKLQEGMSFLNIGSGTGYLSTLAGLVLGPYGINHGIELHRDVVEYAVERQRYFKTSSVSFDEFEYCDPQFVHGNCLQLVPDGHLYDRVYCGAACPPEHENYMKNLIRVGGILVMPFNDQLLQVTRTTETSWETCCVLPVSFATLIVPNQAATADIVQLPERKFLSLQEICRAIIRDVLRKNTLLEHPDMRAQKRPKKLKTGGKKRRRFTMNIFGSISDSDAGPEDGQLAVAVCGDRVTGPQADTEEAREEEAREEEDSEGETDMSDVLQRVLEYRMRQGAWRSHRVVHHHDWPMEGSEDQGIEEDLEDKKDEEESEGVVVQPPSLSTSSDDTDSDAIQSPVISGDTLPITVPSTEKRQQCSSGTSLVSASYTSGIGTCSSVDEHSDIDKVNDVSPSNVGLPASDTGDLDHITNGHTSNDNGHDIANVETVTVRRRHLRKTASLSSCNEEEDEDEDMDVGSSASRSPHNGLQAARPEDDERNEARINFKKCLFEKVNLLPIPLALKQYLLFYRK